MKNIGRGFERGNIVGKLGNFRIGRVEFGDFLIEFGEFRAEELGSFWMLVVMDDAKRASLVRDFLEKTSLLAVANMLRYGRDRVEFEGTLNFTIRRRVVILFGKFFNEVQ